MDSNNKTSFIVICGIFILIVFTYVSAINILPSNIKSDAYYAKIDNNISVKIESFEINDGILNVITSGDPDYYCVKTTKSNPSEKSLCWNTMKNNNVKISIFSGKKYYIWIKDSNNIISGSKTINAQGKDK